MRILAILFAIVLGPYLYSRVMSPWRQVTVHDASHLTSSVADRENDSLRIVTYNIAHGRGLAESNWDGGIATERLARLDEIAELLREFDADVVVLNEVDFDSSWSGGVNQAQYLAENAGYPYRVEQRNLDFRVLFWTWRFGNAVLSRRQITHAQVIDLPGYSTVETLLAGKKRGVECQINIGTSTSISADVRIVGAHLSHRDEGIRVASAQVLNEVASRGELPLIVAGDLNSSPSGFADSFIDEAGENSIDVLDRSALFSRRPMSSPASPDELTFHSARPSAVIDWILIPADWQFKEYRVVSTLLSDHRPIVADVVAP